MTEEVVPDVVYCTLGQSAFWNKPCYRWRTAGSVHLTRTKVQRLGEQSWCSWAGERNGTEMLLWVQETERQISEGDGSWGTLLEFVWWLRLMVCISGQWTGWSWSWCWCLSWSWRRALEGPTAETDGWEWGVRYNVCFNTDRIMILQPPHTSIPDQKSHNLPTILQLRGLSLSLCNATGARMHDSLSVYDSLVVWESAIHHFHYWATALYVLHRQS